MVTGCMTEAVVDFLEEIDVQHKHGQRCSITVNTIDLFQHARFQCPAIQQPRQRIMRGLDF